MNENIKAGTVDKMLERVRALLAKAESTDSQQESDALQAKANELMLKYAIEEAELEATRPAAQRMVPEKIEVDICPRDSHLTDQLSYLAGYVAAHFRCQIVFYGLGKNSWALNVRAIVVGFPTDLRFFEMLFTSLHLHLSGHLEPKPDPQKSFDENVYIMHDAGVKWKRIADLMNRAFSTIADIRYQVPEIRPEAAHWRKSVRPGKGEPDWALVPWPDGHRLINAYKRWCKEIGDTPRAIQSPVTYQRNAAEGYVQHIQIRLWEMRNQEDEEPGTALALRTQDVIDAFREMFPDLEQAKPAAKIRYDQEARAAGRRAAAQADLSTSSRVQNTDRKPLS